MELIRMVTALMIVSIMKEWREVGPDKVVRPHGQTENMWRSMEIHVHFRLSRLTSRYLKLTLITVSYRLE